MWCFFPDFFLHLEKGFERFLGDLAQKQSEKQDEKRSESQGEKRSESQGEKRSENQGENQSENQNREEKAYLKAEYLLPTIVGEGLERGELTVKVLESKDSWFGVTYKEDKEVVVAEIGKLVESGLYG